MTRAPPAPSPRPATGRSVVGAPLPPFDQLITDHGAVVLRVCRAVCGPVEADDAWQETFLAALQAHPRLPPGSDPRAWLVTIAHRKAIDQHRRARRIPEPRAELPDVPSGDGIPGDERRRQAADLWAAVAALPFEQRAAIAYHHLAGLPYAAVGELIGSSEAAARRSAAGGITALRADHRGVLT
ncbi:RNA polymerase sigma factor [Geodermatophilus sp. SYSU D00703]